MRVGSLINHIIGARDIPFERDESQRFLPLIIAVMLCVALLMLSFVLSLDASLKLQNTALSHMAYAEIPAGIDVQSDMFNQIVGVLEEQKTIHNVTVISDQEISSLVEPWLGNSIALDALAMPTLIELELDSSEDAGAPDWDALEQTLHTIHNDIRIDANQPWLASLNNVIGSIQQLGVMLALILCASIIVMILLAARTSLILHSKTIHILHRIGAEDRYILRQFDGYGGMLAFKGAAIGSIIAALAYLALAYGADDYNNTLLPSFSPSLSHLGLFFLAPFAITILAIMSTHYTVAHQLKQMH